MDKEIRDLLENQINNELQASYNYLGAAIYYQSKSLDYFAKLFYEQSLEEHEHAMKIKNYLLDRDQNINLKDIKSAKTNFENLMDPIEFALNSEKEVTKKISHIYDISLQKKDYLTAQFLNWFLEEQVEEEAQFKNLIDKIKTINDINLPFFILNEKLSEKK
ncbi:MAG: ferritin [bacterium]|jgi:ferritin